MSDPITVAIVRQVPLDRSAYADAWARAGQELARAFPGFLGSGWMRSRPESTEWHMAYRFADQESLASWENSDQRRHWLEMAGPYISDSRREHRTGIEGWFDEPAAVVVHQQVSPPPPRWKQSVSIFLPFLPLSMVMNYLLAWLVPGWPIWARVSLSIVVMTPLMTYLLLPLCTRVLGPWLRR